MDKRIIFILISLMLFAGLTSRYLSLISKVNSLKNKYPTFVKKDNNYFFSTVKPKSWVRLNEVSKEVRAAIVTSEDWAFYEHKGLDFNQLKIVLKESWDEGELTRGASTITQQLVKNVFLSNERTLTRKLKEVLLAMELEKRFSKDQILEVYLNIIELGKDLFGIKEAARFYFKKSPSELNAKEGAFLAMLLPSPIKYSVSFRNKKLTPFAKDRIQAILLKLKQVKTITSKELDQYSEERLNFEKTEEALK